MNLTPNPYEPPECSDRSQLARPVPWSVHGFGLTIDLVSAFFIFAMASKVPAGTLSILRSSGLATAMLVSSTAVLLWCIVFLKQCQRLRLRGERLYLLAPMTLFAYFVWRVLVG